MHVGKPDWSSFSFGVLFFTNSQVISDTDSEASRIGNVNMKTVQWRAFAFIPLSFLSPLILLWKEHAYFWSNFIFS